MPSWRFQTEPFFISSANLHLPDSKSFVGFAGVLQCEKNKPWTTYLPHYEMRTLILLSQVVKFIFRFPLSVSQAFISKNPNEKICILTNLVKKWVPFVTVIYLQSHTLQIKEWGRKKSLISNFNLTRKEAKVKRSTRLLINWNLDKTFNETPIFSFSFQYEWHVSKFDLLVRSIGVLFLNNPR